MDNNETPNINLKKEEEKKEKSNTPLTKEEELKRRLEELRKRDPFIYN